MKRLLLLLLLTAPVFAQTLATLPQGTWPADARAISLTITGSSLTATTCADPTTGIQGRIDQALALDGNLTHKVTINVATGPCSGQFTIGPKTGTNSSGTGYIYIVTDDTASLPAVGTRVAASHTVNMPKIITTNTTTGGLRFLAGAHHIYLDGIWVTNSVSATVLVNIDPAATVTANYPHHIVIRRSIIKGDLTVGADVVNGRCVGIGANYVAILDSILDNCVRTSQADTQTFGGWNFAGPLYVDNNYLGSATEHFIFGGSVPATGFINDALGIVPSDITITRNYFTKAYGLGYYYKNFWECKNCQRVLFEGNKTFDYRAGGGQTHALQWTPAAQNVTKNIAAAPTGATESGTTVTITTTAAHGFTAGQEVIISGVTDTAYNVTGLILTTPTTTTFTFTHPSSGLGASGGGTALFFQASQARVQDITIQWNDFRGMSAWSNHNWTAPNVSDARLTGDGTNVNCSGYPTQSPGGCKRARRQNFNNNLVEGVSGTVYGGLGSFMQILGPIDHLISQHNTFIGDGTGTTPALLATSLIQCGSCVDVFSNGWYWRYNVANTKTTQGIYTGHAAQGTASLDWATQGFTYQFVGNVIQGGTAAYPQGNGNVYPAAASTIRFSNLITTGGGDYRLCTAVDTPVVGCPGASPYLDAGDGTPVGVSNWTTFTTKTCGAESGDWSCVGGGSPAPTVDSISPTSGTYQGGTPVTITGTGFQVGASAVVIGSTSCTSTVVVSSTSITCETPAHAAGAVDITVTNPDLQSDTLAGGYTYTGSGAPTISSLATSETGAARGSAFGGYILTVTGTNFAQGATVTVGGVSCGNVDVASATTITCTVALATTIGAVDVVVTNPSAQAATSSGGFTYTKPVVGRP